MRPSETFIVVVASFALDGCAQLLGGPFSADNDAATNSAADARVATDAGSVVDTGVDAYVDAGPCLVIDDGTSSNGTLHPCWSGQWESVVVATGTVNTITPAVGSTWPSATLPDGSLGRRAYGTVSSSSAIALRIAFAPPADLRTYTNFFVTLVAGPTETSTRGYNIVAADAAGRTAQTTVTVFPDTPASDQGLLLLALGAFDLSSVTAIELQVDTSTSSTWDLYIARPRVEH
ncbi:MAG: hypothetical protein ACHREM_11770 [Polyangiales bacterium]